MYKLTRQVQKDHQGHWFVYPAGTCLQPVELAVDSGPGLIQLETVVGGMCDVFDVADLAECDQDESTNQVASIRQQ